MPQVSKYVQTLSKPQQLALKQVFARFPQDVFGKNADETGNHRITYRQFRKTVRIGWGCAMVQWAGMWLGIEPDGYTHS